MNTDDLMNGFGEVEDQLILEMLRIKRDRAWERQLLRKRRRDRIMKISGITAAAAAAVLFIAGPFLGGLRQKESTPVQIVREESIEAVSAESAGEAESSSTDNLPEESTEAVSVESAGEAESSSTDNLPDEKCCLRADAGGLSILDGSGNELAEFPGAWAVIPGELSLDEEPLLWQRGYGSDCGFPQSVFSGSTAVTAEIIWDREAPLPILFPDENASEAHRSGSCGIYSIEEGEWIFDPQEHHYLNLLGDGLWTDSQCFESSGSLMTLGGTVLHTAGGQRTRDMERTAENSGTFYCRFADHILAGRKIFDLKGNLLCELPEECGYILDILDDRIVTDMGGRRGTYFYDFSGQPIAAELSGLLYNGHADGYLNWHAGASVITDLALNPVLSIDDFYRINPEYDPDTAPAEDVPEELAEKPCVRMRLLSADTGKKEYRLLFENMKAETSGLVVTCDSDFRVTRTVKRNTEVTAVKTGNPVSVMTPWSLVENFYGTMIEAYNGGDPDIIREKLDPDSIQCRNIITSMKRLEFVNRYVLDNYGFVQGQWHYPYELRLLDARFAGPQTWIITADLRMGNTHVASPPFMSTDQPVFTVRLIDGTWKISAVDWDVTVIFESSGTVEIQYDEENIKAQLRKIYGEGSGQ